MRKALLVLFLVPLAACGGSNAPSNEAHALSIMRQSGYFPPADSDETIKGALHETCDLLDDHTPQITSEILSDVISPEATGILMGTATNVYCTNHRKEVEAWASS